MENAVAVKEHRVYVEKWSLWMALLGHLIILGEDLREEYGARDIYFDEEVGSPSSWRPGSTVTVYMYPLPSDAEEFAEDRIPGELASITFRETGGLGIHLDDLYGVFYKAYIDHIASRLGKRAPVTTMRRIEYYMAVAEKGEVVELEGDVDRVTIPYFKAWATGHTHPAGHCMFSPKDLETARSMFMAGGLATGVVAEGCLVILWRRGLFTEEDLDALLDLQHGLKHARRREDLTRILQEFQKASRSLVLTAMLAGLPIG